MPNRERPQRKRPGRGVWKARLIIAASIALCCGVAWVTLSRPDSEAEGRTQARTPKFSVDSSPEKQRARNDYIEELIRSGVFENVDKPVNRPHVYVGERWRKLSAREKGKTLGVVLAYYYAKDPQADLVVVRDAATGERIGVFSKRGLDLD